MRKVNRSLLRRGYSLIAVGLLLLQSLFLPDLADVSTVKAQTSVSTWLDTSNQSGSASMSDLTSAISSDNIIKHINALSQQSRCATDPTRAAAINYIKDTLTQEGNTPLIQPFRVEVNGLAGATLQNIVIRKPGTNPQAVHLLTAHYDSSPTRNFPPECSNFAPGANDNGSGVASLLEIARLLNRYQFRDDIEIVFFDAEEFGHYGSQYFVQNWASDKSINPNSLPIGTVVNLDMVAYPRDGKGHEIVWAVAQPHNGQDLANNGAKLVTQYLPNVNYQVYTIGQLFPAARDPNRLSDQQSFWNAGLGQAIFLTEDVKDAIGADPRYHTPSDKLYNQDGSLRLDPDLARQSAQVALTITGANAGPQPRRFFSSISPAFENLWARSDRPVASGVEAGQNVERGYTWGPQPNHILTEPYVEAPNGQRQVVYFDKVRMELTQPNTKPDGVTNGLLVKEMATGQLQLGDNSFKQQQPAQIPVAGDPNNKGQNPAAPTYADFKSLAENTGNTAATGAAVTATLDNQGQVGQNAALGQFAHQQAFITQTNHNIPDVFWNWLNQSGRIYDPTSDSYSNGPIFNWISTSGFPITEAYWVRTKVGGVERDVLVQLFERRVLTYTPDNPAAFRVEMGNVGLHYYSWRYGG